MTVGLALFAGGALAAPLTIALAPNPPNVTLLAAGVAQGEGYFKEFGVDAAIEVLASGITAFRGLEGGQVDFGVFDYNVLAPAVVQGSKIRQIYTATTTKQHVYAVVASVKSCSDLKGKVLAIDEVGGVMEILTRQFLDTCKLKASDVTYAAISGAAGQTAALTAGQVVGAVLPPERVEQMRLLPNAPKVEVIARFSELLPDFLGTGWGATENTIKNKRTELTGAVAALIKATRFIGDQANKAKVMNYIVTFCKTQPEIAEAVYDNYQKLNIWPKDLGIDTKGVDFTNQALGLTAKGVAPKIDMVLDRSIYEAALKLVEAKK